VDISPKTKLTFMRSLYSRKAGVAHGFSKAEPMIVAAIIGLIATLAWPHFWATRVTMEAGVRVGEAIGIARECASYVASTGAGESLTTLPRKNGTLTCDRSGGAVVSGTWALGAGGVRCLGARSTDQSTHALITIASTGDMRCAFGQNGSSDGLQAHNEISEAVNEISEAVTP
jgi:type IV pilus assembly protein PilA